MGFEELRLGDCTRSAVSWSGPSEQEGLGLSFLPTVIKRRHHRLLSSAESFKVRTFVPRSFPCLFRFGHNCHIVKGSLAYVAGRRKGVRKVKMSAGSEGEGTACKDAIVFFVFYVHQMNVKILIGQI